MSVTFQNVLDVGTLEIESLLQNQLLPKGGMKVMREQFRKGFERGADLIKIENLTRNEHVKYADQMLYFVKSKDALLLYTDRFGYALGILIGFLAFKPEIAFESVDIYRRICDTIETLKKLPGFNYQILIRLLGYIKETHRDLDIRTINTMERLLAA
ncbi:hypothetical protein J4457_00905 [Candidatus Woesearchaeota archaeon]|nr:hypothetical protein [Candidatus Woesearchaeota archaeon]